MARQDDDQPQRGAAQLHTVLLLAATVGLAALVCLALVSWFGRMP